MARGDLQRSPSALTFLFRRHTRLYNIIIPISVIRPSSVPPPLLSMTAPHALLLHLLNCYPACFVYPLSQQRDLFRIRRPQLHLLPSKCLFNALNELHVVLRDKRYRLPGASGTGGTADAMDVVLGVCRNIVVDDDVDVGNIQAAVWYQTSVPG